MLGLSFVFIPDTVKVLLFDSLLYSTYHQNDCPDRAHGPNRLACASGVCEVCCSASVAVAVHRSLLVVLITNEFVKSSLEHINIDEGSAFSTTFSPAWAQVRTQQDAYLSTLVSCGLCCFMHFSLSVVMSSIMFRLMRAAGDDLASGQSTFMTELYRTSRILKTASPRSLVILDELGRYIC